MSAWGLRAGPVGVTRLLRLCGLVVHFHKARAGQEGAQERQQLGGAVNVGRKPRWAGSGSDARAPRGKLIWQSRRQQARACMDGQLLCSEQTTGGGAAGVPGAEQARTEGLAPPPHPAP